MPLARLPCGGIDPVGVTSTPVVDRVAGGRPFVATQGGVKAFAPQP